MISAHEFLHPSRGPLRVTGFSLVVITRDFVVVVVALMEY